MSANASSRGALSLAPRYPPDGLQLLVPEEQEEEALVAGNRGARVVGRTSARGPKPLIVQA